MGRFLNAGNEAFAEFSRTRYFVDKSELINKLLEKDITEKFICNSRARRFGKSVTADMLAEANPGRVRYVELLRGLFKNNDAKKYIRLAYLTGIMPVVRTKGQSAINNFKEYTMTNTRDLGRYIGFTEDEVRMLCAKSGVDFEQMKLWYNGYLLSGEAMYNPLSVLNAIEDNVFTQYWTTTGSYEDIDALISRNFDGLREDIIKMLSGNRVAIDVSSGKNDLRTFVNKDEVVTALIHLGYFVYDGRTQEAYVPNREIQAVFYKYMKNDRNDNLSRFMKASEEILNAVLGGDADGAASQIQSVHNGTIEKSRFIKALQIKYNCV